MFFATISDQSTPANAEKLARINERRHDKSVASKPFSHFCPWQIAAELSVASFTMDDGHPEVLLSDTFRGIFHIDADTEILMATVPHDIVPENLRWSDIELNHIIPKAGWLLSTCSTLNFADRLPAPGFKHFCPEALLYRQGVKPTHGGVEFFVSKALVGLPRALWWLAHSMKAMVKPLCKAHEVKDCPFHSVSRSQTGCSGATFSCYPSSQCQGLGVPKSGP